MDPTTFGMIYWALGAAALITSAICPERRSPGS